MKARFLYYVIGNLWVAMAGAQSIPEFFTLSPFNAKNNTAWGPVLKDIVNHEAPGDVNNYDDLVTVGHETCHGIHSYLRNKYFPGKRVNAFYVLENRAVFVNEPNMRKSQVADFVPRSLRGSRFSTYITGQTAWDSTPLYIFDEWNAYVNGGATGVDLVQQGLWKYGWRDAVAGVIEFVAYALATGMAIEKYDPQYLKTHVQFLDFLQWNTERSMEVFNLGRVMDVFKWETQETYYNNLVQAADASALREFTTRTFGSEWTQRVMGF